MKVIKEPKNYSINFNKRNKKEIEHKLRKEYLAAIAAIKEIHITVIKEIWAHFINSLDKML